MAIVMVVVVIQDRSEVSVSCLRIVIIPTCYYHYSAGVSSTFSHYYAAVLIVRIADLARPFVRLSVRLSPFLAGC